MGRDACVSALADLQLDDHDDPALRRRAVLARRARGEGRHDRRALSPSGERHGRERSLFVGARTSGSAVCDFELSPDFGLPGRTRW